MNTINNTAPTNSSFIMYDKAMDLVETIFGEEPIELLSVSVVSNVCKVKLPTHVPLKAICDREDLTVNFSNECTVITVH